MTKLDLATSLGRLIMPAIRAEDPSMFDLASELAKEPAQGGIGAGGFLVFGGDRKTLPGKLAEVRRAAGGRPLLFSSDLERGAGQQVDGLTRLPHLMAIGASQSHDLAQRAGHVTAREARAAGIHLVFAPDADLNTDRRNPIINIRAFGDDPFHVGKLAQSWVRGCRQAGALSCAKHFPGHGHTATDSHLALPRLSATLPTLMARELMPFGLVASGADAADTIMTAHMAVPALTGDPDLPVTLSPRAIQYLRKDLGFRGLIVTDALLMGGITAAFDEAEAGVRALAAGCDILLCPLDARRLHGTVLAALEDGRVPKERVAESLARFEAAVRTARADEPSAFCEATPAPGATELAEEIARAALTRVWGEPPGSACALVVIVSGDDGEPGGEMVAELNRRAGETRILPVTPGSPEGRLKTVAAAVETAASEGRRLGIALLSKVLAWKGGSGFPSREGRFVADLCRAAPGAAVISCGSPYLLEHARGAAFGACAFSDEPVSQRAAAAALLAEAPFPGRSPVRLDLRAAVSA